MAVSGYLALYTTLLGWQQYQNLWQLMVGVGLVFLPFMTMIIHCFLEPFESQAPKSASIVATRRLGIRIITALLVIEFCCVPTIPLHPTVLHYQPVCNNQATLATPGNTGTTYDNQFEVPTDVKVPIIWYAVMAIANGFTQAAINGIDCQPLNYRQLQSQLDLTQITDPVLKKEVVNFYNACYIPAYSKYLSNSDNSSEQSAFQPYFNRYGKDDIGWLGSHAFLSIPGFYDVLQAQTPVVGFPFNAQRDQFEGQVPNHSEWGMPYCTQWWTNPVNGLYQKIEAVLPKEFTLEIAHLVDPSAVMDDGIQNLIHHSLFDPGMSAGEISRGYESLNDDTTEGWFERKTASTMATAGTYYEDAKFLPKITLLINSLPIIQALLLMAIYALLALMMPFSSYRVAFIITGAAVIFAVTFWSYLWQWVHFFDNELLGALYPSGTALNTYLQDHTTNSNEMLVNMVIGGSYIGLPLLFLTMSSWAGLKLGSAATGLLNSMTKPAQDIGDMGIGTAVGAGKMVKNVAGKGAEFAAGKGAKSIIVDAAEDTAETAAEIIL